MFKIRNRIASLFIASFCFIHSQAHNELTLWYKSPAKEWEEALPVGNGRLGAMIFGDTQKERIQFNENTLYSGEPETPKKIDVTAKTLTQGR